MFKNISKDCLKILLKMFKNISKFFLQIFKKILAVPDSVLLGFDYFHIYYLLIIAVPNYALLNIYI